MRKVLSFSAPQVLLISEMSRVSSIAPSGAEVLLKSVEVGEAKSIPLESIPQQYDIGRTVAWLKRGNFQRVASSIE